MGIDHSLSIVGRARCDAKLNRFAFRAKGGRGGLAGVRKKGRMTNSFPNHPQKSNTQESVRRGILCCKSSDYGGLSVGSNRYLPERMRNSSSEGLGLWSRRGRSVEMTLEQGLKTYQQQLPSLLPQHEGKWALIISDGNLLVCESEEEANRIGFATYGKVNDFLVTRIEPEAPHSEPN